MFNLNENPKIKPFIYDRHYEVSAWGGVRSGKSVSLILRTWWQAWGYPENRIVLGRHTATSLRDTTQKQFLEYVRYLNGGNLDHGPVVKKYYKQEGRLVLTNDTEILFVHLDEIERILSMTLGAIAVDQVEEIPYETYLQLHGRLSLWESKAHVERVQEKWKEWMVKFWGKVVKPMNFLTSVGNPHPGWAKRYFRQRKDPTTGDPLPHDPEFKFHWLHTRDNVGNLSENFLKRLENRPASWKKRFLEGSFDAMEGQIYPEFSYKDHCIQSFTIPKRWNRVGSLDIGYTHPTTSHAIAVDEHGNHFVYLEYFQSGKIVSENAEGLKKLYRGEPMKKSASGFLLLHADHGAKAQGLGIAGRNIFDEYKVNGIACVNANKDVQAGIARVSELLHVDPTHTHPITGKLGAPRLYIFSDKCPHLVNEFPAYEWLPHKEGEPEKEKPRKKNDDCMDSLRYGLMSLPRPTEKKKKDNSIDMIEQYGKVLFAELEKERGDDLEPYYKD